MKRKYLFLFVGLCYFLVGKTQTNQLRFPWCQDSKLCLLDTTGVCYPTEKEKLSYPKIDHPKSTIVSFKEIIYFGFKDVHGNIIIPPTFEEVGKFREGIAWVKIDHKRFYYINDQQEPLVAYTFDRCYDFQNGMGRVYDINPDKGYKGYGFINKKGHVVIPLIYTEALDFVQGYAMVKDVNGWYLINQKGEKLLQSCTELSKEQSFFYINKK